MDKTLIIVIVLLFFIVLILLALIGFFMFMFFKQQKRVDKKQEQQPKGKIRKVKFEPLHGHCINHPTEKAVGICNICEKSFCEDCLHTHETLNFCDEHYSIFLESKWIEIDSVQTTPAYPEKGTKLYKFKQSIWEKDKLPTYLQTHYKINHTTDEIESVVCLYAPLKSAEEIKNKLKKFSIKS